MEIKEIEATKEEVLKELNDLRTAMEKGYISDKNPIVKDLMQVFGHLELGGKIIDLPEAFRKAGLDDNDDPKLAIVRADSRFCFLYKYTNGGALFSRNRKETYSVSVSLKKEGDIKLPASTFQFEALDPESRFRQTLTPMIPPRVNIAISARIIPQHYHILFEPEKWAKYNPIPPRDPILGKMLTANLFGVLATWDLTELEARIIKSRI